MYIIYIISSQWPKFPGGPSSQVPKFPVAQVPRWPKFPVAQFLRWPKFPGGPSSQVAQVPGGPSSQVAQVPRGPSSRWPKFPVAQVPRWPKFPGAQVPSGPSSRWPKFPVAQVPGGPSSQWPKQLQNIGCQAYLTFDLLECELDQAGEENWNQMNLKDGTKTRFLCDTNSTFLWICVIWWFYSRQVQMSKLPNNSHYKWLEMATNSTITDKVK